MNYDVLVKKLKTTGDPIIKENYVMIKFSPQDTYHITIYRDQWNDFRKITGLAYHLFHISSEKIIPKCSTYFWVNTKNLLIKKIPPEYFKYGQDQFSMQSSTRYPCSYSRIKHILQKFQKILL